MSNTPASTQVVYKQKRLDLAGNLVANLTGSGNALLKCAPEVKLMDVGDYKLVDDSSLLDRVVTTRFNMCRLDSMKSHTVCNEGGQ